MSRPRPRRGPPTAPGGRCSAGGAARGVIDQVDLVGERRPGDRGLLGGGRRLRGPGAGVAVRGGPAASAGPPGGGRWRGPVPGEWRTSLDRAAYLDGVGSMRQAIREGDVYQVNLCRVLAAPLSVEHGEPDAAALAARLAAGNPAPYGGCDPRARGRLRAAGVGGHRIARAVPAGPRRVGDLRADQGHRGHARRPHREGRRRERDDRRHGAQRPAAGVPPRHRRGHRPAQGRAAPRTGAPGHHRAWRAARRPGWPALLAATFPPASVSGAPKLAALGLIDRLEPVPRGPYCGAVGWLDADTGRAELAVGIRTFWWTPDGGGTLRFGTGAGITWESDAGRRVGRDRAQGATARRARERLSVRQDGPDGGRRPMDDIVVWLDGRLRDPEAPALSPAGPRHHRGRRGLRDLSGDRRPGVRPDPAPGAADPVGRAGLGLDDPDLDAVRAGVDAVLGGAPRPRPAADHRDRRRRTARLHPHAGAADRPGGAGTGAGAAPDPHRPVAAGCATSARRSPGSRRRPTRRTWWPSQTPPGGRGRGVARQHPRRAVRGHRLQRVRRDRRRAAHPAAVQRVPRPASRATWCWSGRPPMACRCASSLDGELPFSVLDEVEAGRAGLALCGSIRTFVPVVELDGTALDRPPR